MPSLTCRLHLSRRGTTVHHRELAELLGRVLADVGVGVSIVFDQVPEARPGTVDLIVGPHEYFIVERDLSLDQRLEIAAASVLVTTERPGSAVWELQRQVCEVALLTLDISPVGVEALTAVGIDALHLPLGYHPSLDRWGGPATDGAGSNGSGDGRDLDVVFLGAASGRRLEVLGPLAPTLAHRRSRLLLHDPLVPVLAPGPHHLARPDKAELLARTKVLLHVHDEDNDRFDWVRAVEAMCNGAVVLTEPSPGFAPLEPFAHFVPADRSLLGAHLTALLTDDAARSAIARDAYDLLRTERCMTDLVRGPVLDALTERAAATVPVTVTAAELVRLARTPAPSTASPAPESAPGSTADEPPDLLRRTQVALKRSLMAQRRTERQLARVLLEADGADPDAVEELTTPAWEAGPDAIDVSVVVPLYDYADTLDEALDSVFASHGTTPEVVVVDDRSTDGSTAVLARYLERHPDRPILALLRAVNAGPSAARDLGVRRARTDRIFLLDADNLVYPDGLRQLGAALDGSDAALAYGIVEVFGDRSTLVSAMPWSAESLVRRAYIDNMCLIRRATWEAQGGFPEDEAGLEDYQFFVSVAASGATGAWVPTVVGRYRSHDAGRGVMASLDLDALTAELRRRHPGLPWPSPSLER